MKTIHLAPKLTLPLDAVTQTFAILGVRGSGKTNTGVVLVEELLTQNQQVVVIDPVDVWWGIKSSKDGKSAGFRQAIEDEPWAEFSTVLDPSKQPQAIAAPAPPLQMPARVDRAPQRRATEADGSLTGPEQRILDALAWLESIGIDRPEQTAVAFLAGYTIGGGAWNNPRGALRTKGLIEYSGDALLLTDAGRSFARFPDVALTTEELQRRVLERLPGPESRILRVLIDAYPKGLANDELARAAGYEPGGGAYNNPRGRLRSLGLIEYRAGEVIARPVLFLEGR